MHILNTPRLHESYHHVVNWYRVAVTELQSENSAVSNEFPLLELISMDSSLLNHRILLVHRYLTGLVSGVSNPMNQVALSMGVFTTESQEEGHIYQ